MEGKAADVVKYLRVSLGLIGTAWKIMMSTPELSLIYKKLFTKEIDNELEEQKVKSKKRNNSILQQTKAEELVDFQRAKFIHEIEENNSPT